MATRKKAPPPAKKTAIQKRAENTAPRKPVDVAAVARVIDPGQRYAESLGSDAFRIAQALLAAQRGDNEAYLTMAGDLEEKWLHFASVLQTRKGAVVGESIEVQPADDSDAASEIADSFHKLVVDTPQFEDLCMDLLDGLNKGYSVCQAHWDTTNPIWVFSEFEHIDPRLFCYDRSTLSELRIKQMGTIDGIPIPPDQFIIHRPKIRTGTPVRAGLARPAAIAWLFHATAIKQWSVLLDVLGMPARIGTYQRGDNTQQEIDELRTALINLGNDSACLIPSGTEIKVFDGRRPSSGDNLYEGFLSYMDSAVSKLVIGATMTVEDGSSLSQAQVHNEVRMDIKRADAKSLAATLNSQVVKPWVRFNYGDLAPLPRVYFDVEPAEDLKSFSDALAPLLLAGLRVRATEVREKFGLSEPEDTDEIIGQGDVPAVLPPGVTAITAKKLPS